MNIRPSPGPPLPPVVQALNKVLGKAMGCLVVCGLLFSCVTFSCIGAINSLGSRSTSSSRGATPESPSAPAPFASSSSSPSSSSTSSSGAQGAKPDEQALTGLTPVELRRAAPGRHVLNVNAPAAGSANWDLLEQIVWATTIAIDWSSEATLQRVDVSGVGALGLVDLTGPEAEVIYRFRTPVAPTPEADDALEKNTATTRRTDGAGGSGAGAGGAELSIHVLRNVTMAVLKDVEAEAGTRQVAGQPVVDSLPMRELVDLLAKRPGFEQTTYDGSLTYDVRDGWIWTWRSAAGAALARLRARDGQPLTAQEAPQRKSAGQALPARTKK